MSAGKEQGLSPDELRQKLYQTFKSRGLLDTLKTQLRNQLIQELQGPTRRGDPLSRRAAAHTPAQPESVIISACNSVVADHLRSVGCDYTLSVFYPECGLSKDKVLSTRDVLQLMKINPHMPLYQSLVSNIQKGPTGFLMSLLSELTDQHISRASCDGSTQTTSISAHKESLVEKMQLIDEEYEALRHRGDRWASVEAKLADFRKEIQEQAQVELNAKLQHFMEVELEKVKREEKERSRREILELRRDLEKTYELKSEALMSREKNAIERLQKQQEIEEKDIYAQRQVVLKEIECVRSREMELKQRMEAFDRTCKLHEEKMKTMDDLLRRRELAVKTMEDSFDQKLKSELLKYQLELKDDYTKRTEKLTENEKSINAETVRLQKEAAVIDARAEEHERSSAEVKRLLAELESSRSQTCLLTQQNERLRQRLEDVSDYPELKKTTLELQTHMRRLTQELEESRELQHRLQTDLSVPSKDVLMLQAELRRQDADHRLAQEEFETQKSVLHTQLQNEVQRCALLKAQLMECEERSRWTSAQTEELKLQLQQTQQALENEILRNHNPSVLDRSVLRLHAEPLLPPDVHSDAARLRTHRSAPDAGVSGFIGAGPIIRGPGLDSELLSDALARIRELDQEAERLDEAYRSHQQRARTDLTLPTLLPRMPCDYTKSAAPQPRASCASAGRPVEKEREVFSRTPSPGERNSRLSPPARRLSSTPRGKRGADVEDIHERMMMTTSDPDRAALMFPERQISPIPPEEMMSSISSPNMKSTARLSSSPPKLQEIVSSSSSESSPRPEKITLLDLTENIQMSSADQECILEKLQDSRSERQGEAEKVQCFPDEHPPSSPSSSSDAEVKKEEEEEQRKSGETLQQETCEEAQENLDESVGHVTVTSSPIGGGGAEGAELPGVAGEENPLQKYMMMLMQDKQSVNKEASANQSPDENLQSESDAHSVGVISREEPDDDFW